MKTIASLITSLITATWIVGIAILSAQNGKAVSLKFLTFRSIQLPTGIVLAFSAGVGVVGGAIAIPILNGANQQKDDRETDDDLEEDIEDDNQETTKEWVESGSKDW
ncbi:MAG TPA: DUF1049 domain-containing protein [Leptolyngbyaceae cyanobacterium]